MDRERVGAGQAAVRPGRTGVRGTRPTGSGGSPGLRAVFVALVPLAWACASAPVPLEPADLDFAMGAYARAIAGYERLLIQGPGEGGDPRYDRIRFRLALAHGLAPEAAADDERAAELLEELAADPAAAPDYRAAARLLLAGRERVDDLRARLERRRAEAAAMSRALAVSSDAAAADLAACRAEAGELAADAESLRGALAAREAEIARLERELSRLDEALERFKEIDTEPDG